MFTLYSQNKAATRVGALMVPYPAWRVVRSEELRRDQYLREVLAESEDKGSLEAEAERLNEKHLLPYRKWMDAFDKSKARAGMYVNSDFVEKLLEKADFIHRVKLCSFHPGAIVTDWVIQIGDCRCSIHRSFGSWPGGEAFSARSYVCIFLEKEDDGVGFPDECETLEKFLGLLRKGAKYELPKFAKQYQA